MRAFGFGPELGSSVLRCQSLEHPGPLVENDDLATGKVEVYAMQSEKAFLLALSDEGECAEVGKRRSDRGKLEGALLIRGGLRFTKFHMVEECEPASNEAQFRADAFSDCLPIGCDAPAARMSMSSIPAKYISDRERIVRSRRL